MHVKTLSEYNVMTLICFCGFIYLFIFLLPRSVILYYRRLSYLSKNIYFSKLLNAPGIKYYEKDFAVKGEKIFQIALLKIFFLFPLTAI